jgi:hypothetical protein
VETECPDNYDRKSEPETLHLKSFIDLVNWSLDRDGRDWIERVPEGWTILFEILSPRNRVICKNDRTELVLHGARGPDFVEVTAEEAREKFGITCRTPEKTRVDSWEDVGKILEEKYTSGIDKEGLVVCDDCFNRLKVKSDAYRRLKVLKGEENFSDKHCFEAIVSEEIDDAIAAWPEIADRVNSLRDRYVEVRSLVKNAIADGKTKYDELLEEHEDPKLAKKLLAEWVHTKPQFTWSWLFAGATRGTDEAIESCLSKVDWTKFIEIRETAFDDDLSS